MTTKRHQSLEKRIAIAAESQRVFDKSLLDADRMRKAGDTLRHIGVSLGVGPEGARKIVDKAQGRLLNYGRIALPHLASATARDDYLVQRMERHKGDLVSAPLSTRALNALLNADIQTVNQLVDALPRLKKLKRAGEMTVAELHGFLRALGRHPESKQTYVVRTPDTCGGTWRIAGTRITLATIASLRCDGCTADTIRTMYPHLSVDQVEGAFAWLDGHGSTLLRLEQGTDLEADRVAQQIHEQWPFIGHDEAYAFYQSLGHVHAAEGAVRVSLWVLKRVIEHKESR